MRRSLLIAATAALALGFGVQSGRLRHPAPSGRAHLRGIVWGRFEMEAKSGVLEEWRFPVKNDNEEPLQLPAIHLDGCSQCVAASWLLPHEFGDGTPTLWPQGNGALVFRS